MIRCVCGREGAAILWKVLSEGSWKVRGASRECPEVKPEPASGIHSQFKIRTSPLQGLNEGTRA